MENIVRSIYSEPVPDDENADGLDNPVKLICAVLDFTKKKRSLNLEYLSVVQYEVQDEAHLKDIISAIIDEEPVKKGKTDKKKMRLSIPEPIYFALRLSDNSDWQFMANEKPFSLPVKNFIARYFGAHKFKKQDGEVKLSNNEDGSKLALVRIYPPTEGGQVKNYDDRFNINLEFIMTDYEGNVQKIPIIIDPEVGWPTGTKPMSE